MDASLIKQTAEQIADDLEGISDRESRVTLLIIWVGRIQDRIRIEYESSLEGC